MKVCSSCHVAKDLIEFYRNAAQRDGLCNQCKVCHRTHQKLYADSPSGRVTRARATAAWRARNPNYQGPRDQLKVQARKALNNALAAGLRKPDSCDRCRKVGAVQGHHHNGYAKEHWLDVVWLCLRCHGRAHRG